MEKLLKLYVMKRFVIVMKTGPIMEAMISCDHTTYISITTIHTYPCFHVYIHYNYFIQIPTMIQIVWNCYSTMQGSRIYRT